MTKEDASAGGGMEALTLLETDTGSILAVGEEDLHYEKARNLKKSKKKEPRNHRAQFDPRSPI